MQEDSNLYDDQMNKHTSPCLGLQQHDAVLPPWRDGPLGRTRPGRQCLHRDPSRFNIRVMLFQTGQFVLAAITPISMV
jgi:hypothetical protein